MKNEKLPQMRLLVTDHCDSICAYCRPSGEGNLACRRIHMSYETAVRAAELYHQAGGTNIKISGGDPVFWEYLGRFIHELKTRIGMENVELITRSTRIRGILNEADSMPDVLNFSLDTLNQKKYSKLTQKTDFDRYIATIEHYARRLHCKINTVLYDTSFDEICEMIRFCRENGICELKLLVY